MADEVLLKDLIAYSRDGEWGPAEPTEGSTAMRVVRGTDFDALHRGAVARLPVRFIPSEKARQKSLVAGDVLVETAGGTALRPTGRSVLIRESHIAASELPLCCASFARFVRVRRDIVDPAYLQLWLEDKWNRRELLAFNTQHTGVARFQWTTFAESTVVPLPDLEAQGRAVEPILAIDDLIENNLRRVAVLEGTAQAIFREWFVRFRYPGHEAVTLVDSAFGPIPDGWTVAELQSIADVNRRSRTPANDELIRYLDISALGDRAIGSLSEMAGGEAPGRARRVVGPGDVVWSMVRPNRRAHALLVDPGPDWIASTGLAVLSATSVSSTWLFEATSTKEFSDYLVSQEGGAAYPAVKPKDFQRASMVVPPLGLDQLFADRVAPMHRLCWSLREQCDALSSLRDLLLPRLVTGQIDVSKLGVDGLAEAASP